MKAILVLEDGSLFDGVSIGGPGERVGEVILNTAVVGYQEMMTDPANAGKILVLTYPLIGNYGVAKKFYESEKCHLAGLVIKEESRTYSNWQAEGSFGDFLKKEGVVAISDVDTRTIAINIRDNGEMLGIISTTNLKKEELLNKLRDYKKSKRLDSIKEVSVKKPSQISAEKSGPRIAVIDLGITNSVIKQLKTLRCNITLLPYDVSPQDILKSKFDGVVISNGPEDDISISKVAATVKDIIGKMPMLGISTGHEIIGLALGGKLKKMKIGHHGVNYPVKPEDSFKGDITAQNHSFMVDDSSIKNKKGVSVSLRNLNDNSIEEMESKSLKFISTQYYPASPGFDEVNNVFNRFLTMMPKGCIKRKNNPTAKSEVQYAKT